MRIAGPDTGGIAMARIDIPQGALVLVGDGRKALFLRNRGTPLHVDLATERVLEHDNPETREQGSDRPGRYLGPDGVSRSALEQTDWHQLEEDRFATEISQALYRLAHANRFDHLIVVAPPKTLGTLRSAFHKEVATRVVAEIPKDLTGHSLPEIAALLG
jgi:protein required for attachment to host cells